MNKIMTKLSGLFLGLAMMVGVGVGVSAHKVSGVKATDAPINTVLWGENFTHFGTNTPSDAGTGTGTTIYDNASITYTQSSENTKGYEEKLAGGTAPELLLSKSNQTWTISGIKSGNAKEISLTFLSNKTTFNLTCSSDAYTVSGSQKSWTLTLKDNTTASETFNLTLKNTGSNNARIDDVVLKVTKVGTIEPIGPVIADSMTLSAQPTPLINSMDPSFDYELNLIEKTSTTISVNFGDNIPSDTTVTYNARKIDGSEYNAKDVFSRSENTVTAKEYQENLQATLTVTSNSNPLLTKTILVTVISRPREVITERVDTIDNEFTDVGTGTSYTTWTKTGQNSTVTYSGNSAGDSSTVQIRSKDNSGIVTKTSCGYVKSIEIKFNTNKTASSDRTVAIYGKNTTYNSSYDLYVSEKQGIELGSAEIEDGSNQTITINGDYAYIGIRSKSGAIYLDEIIITWNYVHNESDVTSVDEFIQNYMHLEDYDTGGSIGSEGGNGSCVDYYDKNGQNGAKYHFNQLLNNQKEIILNSKSVYGTIEGFEYKYSDIKDRLSEWATANHDTLDSEQMILKTLSERSFVRLFSIENKLSVWIIAVISAAGLSAIGGYFFYHKRKEI